MSTTPPGARTPVQERSRNLLGVDVEMGGGGRGAQQKTQVAFYRIYCPSTILQPIMVGVMIQIISGSRIDAFTDWGGAENLL